MTGINQISSLKDADINGLSNSKSYNDALMLEGIENLNKYLKGVIIKKWFKESPKIIALSKSFGILDKKKITNLLIDLNSEELPIMDGSAKNFVENINELGFKVSDQPIRIIKINKKETSEVAKLIGSDVILGLNTNYSILTAKNKIKHFTKIKKIYVLIVKPNFGCSTKDIYSKVRNFDKPKFNKPSKKMFNYNNLINMKNSLEPIVFNKYPKLKRVKLDLEKSSNPIFVRMTGSGSAIAAYFQSKERCEHAKKSVIKKYRNYWCIASKTI